MKAIMNGIWNAGANVVGMISGIISSVFVVRNLSPEVYGELSYYLWLIGILNALVSLAFPNSLTKIRSELLGQRKYEEQRQLTLYIYLLMFCTSLVVTILFFIWALSQPINNFFVFAVIGMTIMPNVLGSLLRSTLWGGEAYKPVSIATASGSVIQLVCILWITWKNPIVNNYLLALSIPVFIQFAFLVSYFLLRKSANIHRRILKPPKKETVVLYTNYLLPSILIMIYLAVVWQRSEIFFLNRYSVKSELGFYNISFTMYAIFSELGWALIQGYYPRLSSLFGSKNWDEIKREFEHAFIFVIIYAIPVCLGGLALIGTLIPLVYGQKMISAILPARILYFGMVPAVATGILNIALSALGGVWLLAFNGLAVSIFNILIDLLLIPRYGAVGAALANTSSQVVIFGMLLILVNQKFHLAIPWKNVMKLILYGLATTFFLPSLILQLIPIPWLGLFLAIMMSAIIYSLLLMSSKTLMPYIPWKVFLSRRFLPVD